jgi:hypothetical protein
MRAVPAGGWSRLSERAVQIKSVDGLAVYEAKFWADESIGQVKAALAAHFTTAGGGARGFELRTGFPNKLYTEPQQVATHILCTWARHSRGLRAHGPDGLRCAVQTLCEAGLVPNAIMMLRLAAPETAAGGTDAMGRHTGPEAASDASGFSIESSWA